MNDRAEEGVEQELDRRVFPVLAPPDGDQEVHRQQHHLEEDVEEEQVERQEDPHHARRQQQVEREVALDLLLDVPRRQAGQDAHQAGQDDQAEADPVQAQVVLDVEVGDPGVADDQVVDGVARLGARGRPGPGERGRRQGVIRGAFGQRRRRGGAGGHVGRERHQGQCEGDQRHAQRESLDRQLRPLGDQEHDQAPGQRDKPEQAQQQVVAHEVDTTSKSGPRDQDRGPGLGRHRLESIDSTNSESRRTCPRRARPARRPGTSGSCGPGRSGCRGPSRRRRRRPGRPH